MTVICLTVLKGLNTYHYRTEDHYFDMVEKPIIQPFSNGVLWNLRDLQGFLVQWLIDLPFDGAFIVMGAMPLGRYSCMRPMILLAVCRGCILTTTVREVFFPLLTTNARGMLPTHQQ